MLSARLANVLNHLITSLTNAYAMPESIWQNPVRLARKQTIEIEIIILFSKGIESEENILSSQKSATTSRLLANAASEQQGPKSW